MIKLKDLLNEEVLSLTEKQLKGLNGIDDKTPLTKISYQQKLKIIQGTGNNISFKVPKGMSRNFWQVFSKGKIKSGKNGEGNKVYFLPGKFIDSPHYSSEKELVNNVLWDKMEEIRRFNESIKEGKLTEGKFQMKGKHLYMPDGELSSIPGNNDRDAIMVQIKRDTFGIYMNQGKLYAVGSYDKTFKNGNDLANWLNKEKAKYLGIDDR
tara:strand:- start:1 stop:627 length:627 start_codon:yes stop_codon:yes gene_type:complete